jgi:hypothetical protein
MPHTTRAGGGGHHSQEPIDAEAAVRPRRAQCGLWSPPPSSSARGRLSPVCSWNGGTGGVDIVSALERVAARGTVLDPEVISPTSAD